jgi:hypothetical protein
VSRVAATRLANVPDVVNLTLGTFKAVDSVITAGTREDGKPTNVCDKQIDSAVSVWKIVISVIKTFWLIIGDMESVDRPVIAVKVLIPAVTVMVDEFIHGSVEYGVFTKNGVFTEDGVDPESSTANRAAHFARGGFCET